MDIGILVKLTARAWSLEILALLYAGVPGRQASLLNESGAGRTAFGQSLAHLIELGLLERNPGYGHPLRPEFQMTLAGEHVAKMAFDVIRAVPEPIDFRLLRRSWTVPVLAAAHTPKRFSEMKMSLGSITDRALSMTLDQLQEREWMRRDVDVNAKPLRPLYQATNTGLIVSQAACAS